MFTKKSASSRRARQFSFGRRNRSSRRSSPAQLLFSPLLRLLELFIGFQNRKVAMEKEKENDILSSMISEKAGLFIFSAAFYFSFAAFLNDFF